MEDITGLIIYLILAIIGVLAGIYRNKNRKRSVIPPPAETPSAETGPEESYKSEYDPFAGIFEEKFEEEYSKAENNIREEEFVDEQPAKEEELIIDQEVKEEDIYKEKYEEGAAVFDETKQVIISDDYSEITDSSISDQELTKDLTVTDQEKTIIGEGDESSEKKSGFDLRKAVIYSEILKRREY
jgi:hypothetical protein